MDKWLWIYENHIMWTGDEDESNLCSKLNTTWAVVKIGPVKKSHLCRIILGSNPVQAWVFFRRYFHHCSGSVHYCEELFHIQIIYGMNQSCYPPSFLRSELLH